MRIRRKIVKRSGGFTLTELLAATAIISILTTFSIPAFSRWVPGYKLRSAARDLLSDLALARMTAVNQKGECAVVFDTTRNRYRIWSAGPNKVFDNASGDDMLVKTVNLGQYGSGIGYGNGSATSPLGGTFGDGITFLSNRLIFDPSGMLKSLTGGYVYLQNSRHGSCAIGVLGSGVILLKKWTGKEWQ